MEKNCVRHVRSYRSRVRTVVEEDRYGSIAKRDPTESNSAVNGYEHDKYGHTLKTKHLRADRQT